jgi:hypothetical protein
MPTQMAAPAQDPDVAASFTPESPIGQVVDRQRPLAMSAVLAAAVRLSDPDVSAKPPERRAKVERVAQGVVAGTRRAEAALSPANRAATKRREAQHLENDVRRDHGRSTPGGVLRSRVSDRVGWSSSQFVRS